MDFAKDSIVSVNVQGDISIRLPEKKIRKHMTTEEISAALRSLLPVVACVFRLNAGDPSVVYIEKKEGCLGIDLDTEKTPWGDRAKLGKVKTVLL